MVALAASLSYIFHVGVTAVLKISAANKSFKAIASEPSNFTCSQALRMC
jgi:hypothetical protein